MFKQHIHHDRSGFEAAFLRDESGMTLPLIGLTCMMLLGSIGATVDFAREQMIQSRLSYALDAAGLAAGSTISTTNANSEVTKYLSANFPTGYLGTTSPSASVTVSSDNLTLTLTAQTTVAPIFMQIFGVSTQTIKATSQITRATSGLELALVLDNTGSMNSSSKLTSLKSAATTLVNTLFGAGNTANNLWIGLVPFSQTVNIGTSRTNWLNSTTFSYCTGDSWTGCVDARQSGLDVTDDSPLASSANLFQRYFWPYDNYNPWKTYNYYTGKYVCSSSSSANPNIYCPQTMQFLTANQTTILNAINAMTAAGNTHINLGLVWGWRMLSPNWKTAWASTNTYNSEQLPLNYGTKHMNKAVVLLTDGENTMSDSDRTAYWYLHDGRLGTTSSSQAVTNLNTRMTTVCNALKSKGVFVYTIALGNPGTNIQTLLKNCATASNYYFNSPSASDLQSVFSQIADSLSNLRVSQ